MKNKSVIIFILICLFLAVPNFFSKVSALETTSFNILETSSNETETDIKNEHFLNLENITFFDKNDNYLIYTLDNSTINIYNLNDKKIINLQKNEVDITFTNVTRIKIINNILIIISANKINFYEINNNFNEKIIETEFNFDFIDLHLFNLELNIVCSKNKNIKCYKFNSDLEYVSSFEKDLSSVLSNSISNLTISNKHIFILSNNFMFKFNLNNENFLSNYTNFSFTPFNPNIIRNINFNNQTYLGVIYNNFTNFNIYNIYDYSVCSNVFSSQIIDYTLEHINSPQNIEVIDDYLYVSDSTNKNIKQYQIGIGETDELIISPILIEFSSTGSSIGRFNNSNQILIKDDNHKIVCDTLNNRVQILYSNKTKIINKFGNENLLEPSTTLLDENGNLYVFSKTNVVNESTLVKYDSNYDYKSNYSQNTNGNNIGSVIDATITKNNEIYCLDKTNNKLLKFNNINFSNMADITLSSNSKIRYLYNLNKLLIYNNNSLLIYNLDGSLLAEENLDYTVKDLKIDLKNNIYILSNDSTIKIININISNYDFLLTNTIQNNYYSNFSNFEICLSNNNIYAFNSNIQAIQFFEESKITENIFTNISNITEKISNPDIFNIYSLASNKNIFLLPFNLGDYYNNINKVIVIENFDSYSFVLFNINNKIQTGYVKTEYLTKIDNNMNNAELYPTSPVISIYKYPTINQIDNNTINLQTLSTQNKITVLGSVSSSIDNNKFYIYKIEDNYGYILSTDLTSKNSSNITYYKQPNAQILILDNSENITVYLNNDIESAIIDNLSDSKRIYVENFDKESELTKIVYVDENQNQIEGYVDTDYIKLYKIDNSSKIAIILIASSVLLFLVLLIIYKKTKKKIR